MKIITLVLAAVLAVASVSAIAHGGRTDSQGCHNDKKAGTRHCLSAVELLTQGRLTGPNQEAASRPPRGSPLFKRSSADLTLRSTIN
ncbi:YHYH domain-containing protein [Pseudomonas sp. Z1-12]|uniref:YHYH domain-containing protein n=1 Tax=Pseudomonas sp. Z1-12 TaxID=2817408 RepID=UPI003DA98AA5